MADKGCKYFDELIRDLAESFLARECIDRNPESVGSSSRALAALVWTLWKLEKRRDLASPFDRRPEQDLSATRKTSQAKFQLITSKHARTNKQTSKQTNKQTNKETKQKKQTNKRENTLFPQMVRGSKAHVILICEAGSLKHYEKYLAEFGWTNAENLLFLAGLGEEGSIQQIAGPREDYASKFVQDNL